MHYHVADPTRHNRASMIDLDKIPRELRLPTPRRLRPRNSLPASAYIAGWALILLSAGFTVWSVGEVVLLANAETVEGRVIDTFTTQGGGRGGIARHLTYRYDDHGSLREANQVVQSEGRFASFSLNDPLTVRVIHLRAWTVSEPDFVFRHLFQERGILWATTLALDLLFAYVTLELRRQRWLVSCGTPAAGHIMSFDMQEGISSRVTLRYKFLLPSGESCLKKQRLSRQSFELLNRRRSICVLYNPRRPSRSMIYQLAWWRCVDQAEQMSVVL